jgi:hypothetical protein
VVWFIAFWLLFAVAGCLGLTKPIEWLGSAAAMVAALPSIVTGVNKILNTRRCEAEVSQAFQKHRWAAARGPAPGPTAQPGTLPPAGRSLAEELRAIVEARFGPAPDLRAKAYGWPQGVLAYFAPLAGRFVSNGFKLNASEEEALAMLCFFTAIIVGVLVSRVASRKRLVALIEAGDPGVLQELESGWNRIQQEEAEKRQAAAEQAKERQARAKADPSDRIRTGLKSPDPNVRTNAASQLMVHPRPDLLDVAAAALSDPERTVRCYAASYLGDHGNATHVEALKRGWLREHREGYENARAVMYGAIQKITGKGVSEMGMLLDDLLRSAKR